MRATILKVMLLLFLLTQPSFAYCVEGEVVRAIVHGIGKMVQAIADGVAKHSKNEKVRKVAQGVSKGSDILIGAAGTEAAQSYEESSKRSWYESLPDEQRIWYENLPDEKKIFFDRTEYKEKRDADVERRKREKEERKERLRNMPQADWGEYPNEIENNTDFYITIKDYFWDDPNWSIGPRRTETLINNNLFRSAADYTFIYDDNKISFDLRNFGRELYIYDIKEEFGENETDILFINDTDLSISITGYDISITLPPRGDYYRIKNKPSFQGVINDDPDRYGWDYDFAYDATKVKWIKIGERDVRFIGINADQVSYEKTESDWGFEPETLKLLPYENSNDFTDNSITAESSFESQPAEIVAEPPPPPPPVAIVPEPSHPQNEPPLVTQFSVPLIKGFERGYYYVQLASFRSAELAQSEITKIGNGYPVVVMKTIVNVRGEDMLVHRLLIGPVSYSQSRTFLRQFRAAYYDAFIWLGR